MYQSLGLVHVYMQGVLICIHDSISSLLKTTITQHVNIKAPTITDSLLLLVVQSNSISSWSKKIVFILLSGQ